jgi:acyl carrier protein
MDLPPDLAAQAIEFELATIREIIASETGISISELTPTLAFSDIGIDSLVSLTIIDRIREYIDIEIDRSFFVRYGTLEEVHTALNMGNWRRAFSERGGHASYAVDGTGPDSSRTLAIECWVWGTSGPQMGTSLQESRCDSECKVSRIECRDIQKYLGDRNPEIPDTPEPRRNSVPKASMRIILRKQKSSLADPFWDNGVTVNMLNEALGCSANHEYLTKHDAGVCGRFMTATKKPGMFAHTFKVLES